MKTKFILELLNRIIKYAFAHSPFYTLELSWHGF